MLATQPGEGPLHHPPFRQEEEAVASRRSLNNLEADLPPGPLPPQPGDQVPCIGRIRPDTPQAGKLIPQTRQQAFGGRAVWPVGGRDDHAKQQPSRIDEAMALATLDMFGGIIAAAPPCLVVLTDWQSMFPALGWRWRPSASRTSPRRRSCITSQVASLRHGQKAL